MTISNHSRRVRASARTLARRKRVAKKTARVQKTAGSEIYDVLQVCDAFGQLGHFRRTLDSMLDGTALSQLDAGELEIVADFLQSIVDADLGSASHEAQDWIDEIQGN